jgi:hypothetical protein
MVRNKRAETDIEYEAKRIYRNLCDAYVDGLISSRNYDHFYDIFLNAITEKNCKFDRLFSHYCAYNKYSYGVKKTR